MIGQLISINADQYEIKNNEKKYIVNAAGRLRLNEASPIVGDIVEFTPGEFLTKVLPRRNFLNRPKVANIDQAIIVTSLVEPNYSSILLNKFLAIIEHNKIKPIILFTKKDLTVESHLKEYINQGYETYEIDNISKKGITEISKIFKNKLSVFTGQTGAGKSSTINSIAGLNLQTDKISKSLGRGKHTTRVVKIFDWMDGQLIDTPGFSSLDFNLTKLELSRSFHDFEKASLKCKFSRSCIHYKEIHCEVKEMVIRNEITKQRYKDYVRLIEEVDNEKNSSFDFR